VSDNVRAFPGNTVPSAEPRPGLISALEETLEAARRGDLQSFVGTGFTADGKRYTMHGGTIHQNVYEMLGAINWLGQEYIDRTLDRTEGYKG
jgi:hypothetical protein